MGSSRRSFLKTLGGAAALGVVGASSDARAEYALFGGTAYKVLEIFLSGGLSYRDTIWTPTSDGGPWCPPLSALNWADDCRWGDSDGDGWARVDWPKNAIGPGASPSAAGALLSGPGVLAVVPAANLPSASPTPRQLGAANCSAALDGLVNGGGPGRASLMPYTRALAMRHAEPSLMPHEAATPYALTGSRLGRPNFTGMAAAVAAQYAPAGGLPPVGTSLVFHGPVPPVYVDYTCATGYYGPQFRPPTIRFPDPSFQRRLGDSIQRNVERGALDDYYTSQVAAQLGGVRSGAFAGYQAGFSQQQQASTLRALLNTAPTFGAPLDSNSGPDRVGRMISTAASLLKGGTTKYIAVLDPGAVGSFDTHGSTGWVAHAGIHNFNLWWVLSQIQANFTPTDLQGIVIVIHSEFGRQLSYELSSHNPWGYGALVLGGPTVGGVLHGSVGIIDPTNGTAKDAISPLDLRAAMYLAAQVEPFDTPVGSPTFDTGDVLGLDQWGRQYGELNTLGLSAAQLIGNDTPASLKSSIRHGLAQAVFGGS
jgi:hypothetical protein